MLLWLLAPESGMISKGKQIMWGFIKQKIVPMLLQAVVDAKAEEYSQHLAMIADELAALQEQEQQFENFPDLAVEDAPNSTDPLDDMNEDGDGPAGPPAGP